MPRVRPRCHLALEVNGNEIPERAWKILAAVEECGGVEGVASALSIPVDEAAKCVRMVEEALGESVLRGNGLTETGCELLRTYRRIRDALDLFVRRPYKVPSLAVDAVIIRNGRILLIRRGNEPFRGLYALPGGFVEYGERVEETLRREVLEETGLRVVSHRLVGVYSSPERDPRWHTVSIAYLAECEGEPAAGDDACEVAWFPLSALPPLAFDHEKIVRDALSLLP